MIIDKPLNATPYAAEIPAISHILLTKTSQKTCLNVSEPHGNLFWPIRATELVFLIFFSKFNTHS